MADPKLKLGNDIWATKQKSLLAYNDEGGNYKSLPFQVERISGGSYVGRNGLVQTAASNEPRIDFLNNTKGGLLLEPQRTNYFLNSNDASQWSTITSNGTITRAANYATAPDGSETATRLQASVTGSGYALVSGSTTSFVGDYSGTVYVKSTSGANQNVCFTGRNAGNNVFTVTGEWQRFEINGSTTTGLNAYMNIGVYTSFTGADNPIDILIWGGQIESGTYASSIIPTSSAAVTRVVDTCNITGLQSNIMNGATEGTLFLELEFERESNGDAMQWRSSTSNAGRGYFYGTQMGFADTYGANGVVIYGLTENSKLKAAFRLNSLSNATVFLNGTKGGTGNGNTWGDIGQLLFNGTYWKMKINEIKMYNTALSDSELQVLTTI